MGDQTVEALNRMIDSAGRDDLEVVSTAAGEASVLEKVLEMIRQSRDEAHALLPRNTRTWTTSDEIQAAEWVTLCGVLRKANAILEEGKVGA